MLIFFSMIATVYLSAAEEDFFALEDTVVTTATKTKMKIKEAPAAVYVINEKQIRERGYKTLVDALHDVPGFEIHHPNGLMPDLIHQRGMYGNNQRTLVYIDGVLDNNIFEMAALGGTVRFPLHNVERIEIISGPASALYGANAFNGIINIITKDGKGKVDVDVNAFSGSWMSKDYMSYGVNFAARGKLSSEPGSFQYSINGYYEKSDGPDFSGVQDLGPNNTGYWWSDNYNASWYDTYNISGKLSFKNIRLQFVNWQYKQGEGVDSYGYYTIDTDKLPGFKGSSWNFRNNSVALGYLFEAASTLSFDTEVNARWTKLLDTTGEQYPSWGASSYYGDGSKVATIYNPATAVFDEITNYARYDNAYEIKERIQWEILKNLSLTAGLEALFIEVPKDYANNNTANIRYDYKNYAGFAQLMFRPINFISLTGGYRYDDHSQYGSIHTPRFSFVATPGDFTFKGLFSTGFRAPTTWELYSTTSTRMANPDGLEPEKLIAGEIGLGYRFLKRYFVGAQGYYNKVSDLILEVSTATPDGSGGFYNQIRNVGTAIAKGIEFQTDLQVINSLSIFANYTYSVGEYDFPADVPASVINATTIKNGTEIPNLAPHKINIGVTYTVLPGLSIHTRANYVSRRKTLAQNSYTDSVGSYTLWHANIRWEDAIVKGVYLQLTGKNLLDEKAFDPGMRAQKGWWAAVMPLEGRSVWLTLGYKF